MKEIPFLQHHPLLPLPGGVGSNGRSSTSSVARRRRVVASLDHQRGATNDDTSGALGDGSIGVLLTEQQWRTGGGDDGPAATSTALVPLQLDDGLEAPRFDNATLRLDAGDESSAALLRGLSSVHYSQVGDRVVCTSGLLSAEGSGGGGGGGCTVLRISARDYAGVSSRNASGDSSRDYQHHGCRDLEVDLSPLMKNQGVSRNGGPNGVLPNGTSFEGPIVGTACFVTHPQIINNEASSEEGGEIMMMDDASTSSQSYLHVRMVNLHGTILSLAFSYPDLSPAVTNNSFLLPLSLLKDNNNLLRPHPGSSIEYNQVCFPTPTTVAFALNPHLYCVDLGDCTGEGSSNGGAITRVWTNVHRLVSDPVADDIDDDGYEDGGMAAGSSARKRPRKSVGLGGMLTKFMGMGGYGDGYGNDEDYEYDDEGGEEDGGGQGGVTGGRRYAIPSIAALANLPTSADDAADNNSIARVATLHSDGSLRIWAAEPSRKETNGDRLRIPSVQRIAINSSSGGKRRYVDPPVPSPSTWDPSCRDALTLSGRCLFDTDGTSYSYEVVLHAQCYDSVQKDGGGGSSSVYVFRGAIVGGSSAAGGNFDNNNDGVYFPSGDTARMQILSLPNGTASVTDVSWSGSADSGNDLMVLLSRRDPTIVGAESFYDMSDEGDGGGAKMTLALYLSDGKRTPSYSSDAVLPTNTTLTYLDLNHSGATFGLLSVEEEIDRYHLSSISRDDKGEDDMETTDGGDNAHLLSSIPESESKIDKAGLLSILQPYGRNRPSALAVYRSMSSLGLLDDNNITISEISPATILSAMRKWKKRANFQRQGQSSSTKNGGGLLSALVPVVGDEGENQGVSVYHAFATAGGAKASGGTTDDMMEDEEDVATKNATNDVELSLRAHKLRWLRLLSEIRRQESTLDEALELAMLPTASATNILVRGSMTSVLSIAHDDTSSPPASAQSSARARKQENEIMDGE